MADDLCGTHGDAKGCEETKHILYQTPRPSCLNASRASEQLLGRLRIDDD